MATDGVGLPSKTHSSQRIPELHSRTKVTRSRRHPNRLPCLFNPPQTSASAACVTTSVPSMLLPPSLLSIPLSYIPLHYFICNFLFHVLLHTCTYIPAFLLHLSPLPSCPLLRFCFLISFSNCTPSHAPSYRSQRLVTGNDPSELVLGAASQ